MIFSTYISNSIQRVSGFTPEEAVRLPGKDFIHPDDRKKYEDTFTDLLNNPRKVRTDIFRMKNKEGKYIWIERTAQNLIDEPSIKGIISNFRDISERVEREGAMIASNESLKKANQELDKFVYSASHDLRAPLASILGLTNLLKLEVSEPAVLETISYIDDSINKLDEFIHEILQYSRNTRLDVKREEINFEELISEITNNLKFMAITDCARHPEIKIHVDSKVPFYSDKHRISIILRNLISNAFRYIDQHKKDQFIEIVLNTSAEEALLTVKDNGIGIGKEYHDKIFEMFYRLSQNSVGSGLGLYIVKETLDKLQGIINVISEPGKGSEFIVSLPNLYKK